MSSTSSLTSLGDELDEDVVVSDEEEEEDEAMELGVDRSPRAMKVRTAKMMKVS